MAVLGCWIAFAPVPAAADARGCSCVVSDAESMKKRECALCREAEAQPRDVEFFVLHDTSPRKPNQWLVLPRAHGPGPHPLDQMTKDARTRMWKFAIAEARSRFGENGWGVAYNGEKIRTQCHLHLHVGRFITAAENSKFKQVRRPEDFPAPADGGIFIHPVKGGYHVHTGEDIMETSLVR
jgi:diadenosine tetraphosphate (Ap4A) HIT family hydrolase